MMKIIHTADWHLGQRFNDRDRKREHKAFLNDLLDIIQAEHIDALLVAGDIFDAANPPNYAKKQYYDFLRAALGYCKNIIITGGNHDSIATLNAPKTLLKYFNIHVVGGAMANLQDEIIPIKNAAGAIIGVVGAVPFLRERDIKTAEAGETYTEREERIRIGIKEHYYALYQLMEQQYPQLPKIAMGHLFAAGSQTSDSEKEIHIGNRGRVGVETFPKGFNYVALGHIHKPQLVKGNQHIRYCGSPIPLSFSERKDHKQVLLVSFNNNNLSEIKSIPIQTYRPLKRYKGNLQQLQQQLQAIQHSEKLPPIWAEVHVKTQRVELDLNRRIKEMVADKNIEILSVQVVREDREKSLEQQLLEQKNLNELKETDVFIKKCESAGLDIQNNEQDTVVLYTFYELLEWMEEKND